MPLFQSLQICRFRWMLFSLVFVVSAMPIVAELTGRDTVPIGLTIVVIGSLFASERGMWRIVFPPALLILGLVWMCALYPNPKFEGAHFFAITALLVFAMVESFGFLRHRTEIDREALAAAASIYLLFGLACGALYSAFAIYRPGGLEFVESAKIPGFYDNVYFSFVSLTTIGFGELVPRDSLSRSLALFEAIAGVFYVALVISHFAKLFEPMNRGNVK